MRTKTGVRILYLFQSSLKITCIVCFLLAGLTGCLYGRKIEYLVIIENRLDESIYLCKSELKENCYEVKNGKSEAFQFYEKDIDNRWISALKKNNVRFCGRDVFMPEIVAAAGVARERQHYIIKIDTLVEKNLCSKKYPGQ
ncbi:hypothetical protein ACO0LF_27145 [Undibacterium sp. Di27W]|uniref:hypothetical protein n=1 Tax=Undibacterium sp. Di27W TaxID=3413036 RepID=UPI003BF1EFD2